MGIPLILGVRPNSGARFENRKDDHVSLVGASLEVDQSKPQQSFWTLVSPAWGNLKPIVEVLSYHKCPVRSRSGGATASGYRFVCFEPFVSGYRCVYSPTVFIYPKFQPSSPTTKNRLFSYGITINFYGRGQKVGSALKIEKVVMFVLLYCQ